MEATNPPSEPNSPKFRKPLLVFVLGSVAGVIIWMLGPVLFGKKEIWDAGVGKYLLLLTIGNFLVSMISPKHCYVASFGLYSGQLAYLFTAFPLSPFFVLGTLLLGVYSLVSTVGGLILVLSSAVKKRASRKA